MVSGEYYLKFELLGLPKRTNNNKGHWTKRYKEAQLWKQRVWLAVNNKRAKPPAPLKKAKLTLTRISSVRPDFDGLVSSFKHVIDGLIEAGVIANDDYDTIGYPDYRWFPGSPGAGGIRVEVAG